MSQKRREGARPPLAAAGHLYKRSVLGFENKYGSVRGLGRLWALDEEAARRCSGPLSSRCLHSRSAAAGPCWLRAWREARGVPCAGPLGRDRARGAPSGPCCRPHPSAWAAWRSAGGCARPRSACGCLEQVRGATAPAWGRRPQGPHPERAPPRRPRAALGAQRAPPAWYVRRRRGHPGSGSGSGSLALRGSDLDASNVLGPVRVGRFRFRTCKPFPAEKLRAGSPGRMDLRGTDRVRLQSWWLS